MISNCGHDERGKYSGGKAGDQGGEWVIRSWYSRPWTVVLRHPDPLIRKMIATFGAEAALNEHIGYDQSERYTFWYELRVSGYRPGNIKNDCEADCSSGVASIIKAIGHLTGRAELENVSIYMYTGDQRDTLVKAGFVAMTTERVLTSEDYLEEGDILLCEHHHTAINLTKGKKTEWSEAYMTTLKKGSVPKGTPEIYTFQRLMSCLGFYTDKVDGSYGKNSEKACRDFQTQHGLEADGVCGPMTWKELLTNTTT